MMGRDQIATKLDLFTFRGGEHFLYTVHKTDKGG